MWIIKLTKPNLLKHKNQKYNNQKVADTTYTRIPFA